MSCSCGGNRGTGRGGGQRASLGGAALRPSGQRTEGPGGLVLLRGAICSASPADGCVTLCPLPDVSEPPLGAGPARRPGRLLPWSAYSAKGGPGPACPAPRRHSRNGAFLQLRTVLSTFGCLYLGVRVGGAAGGGVAVACCLSARCLPGFGPADPLVPLQVAQMSKSVT